MQVNKESDWTEIAQEGVFKSLVDPDTPTDINSQNQKFELLVSENVAQLYLMLQCGEVDDVNHTLGLKVLNAEVECANGTGSPHTLMVPLSLEPQAVPYIVVPYMCNKSGAMLDQETHFKLTIYSDVPNVRFV